MLVFGLYPGTQDRGKTGIRVFFSGDMISVAFFFVLFLQPAAAKQSRAEQSSSNGNYVIREDSNET